MKRPRNGASGYSCLASAAAVLLAAAAAPAQEQPVIIGQQSRLPPFGYTPIRGYLELLNQYSHDSSTGGASEDLETSELRFQQTLNLATNAYVLHPNFLNLSLQGEFGLIEDRFDSDGQDERQNSLLYLWDVSGQFFQLQPNNLTLYTSRTESIVDRAFAESFRSSYTIYGALLNTRFGDIPSRFRVYRTEQEQTTLQGGADFNLDENVFEWHTEANPTPNQFLTWDYRVNQTDQSSVDGVDDSTIGQAASLSHSIAFGPANTYNLGSTFIYSDSTGDFGVERFHVDERLRMKHTPRFETQYEYIFDQQNSQTIDRTFNRATAEFWHRLYDSLFTHGEAGYINVDSGAGGGNEDWFGTLDTHYTKQVPYGQFDATLDLGYNIRTTSEGSEATPVVDQPFVFVGFQPIFIPGQQVDPDSIELTDPFGLIYVEGLDYTVTQRPDGVQIDPIVGGAIPPDSTVLADYLVDPLPDSTIRSGAFALSLRYDILEGRLAGFSPYGRFAILEQDISGGGGVLQPNSFVDYLAGLEYRRAGLRVSGEYEIFDSELDPYNAWRLMARYDRRASGSTWYNAQLNYTYTDYTDRDQQNGNLNAALRVSQLLTPQLVVSGTVGYVNIDDSEGGLTQGIQETLEIR